MNGSSKEKSKVVNKIAQGNAAQLLVASELNRRGWSAAVALGNTPHVDVLCSNADGTRFAFIQVKSFHLTSKSCTVGTKAENTYSENFFWIIVGLADLKEHHDMFYIISASEMSKNIRRIHKKWLETPGRNGKVHKDNSIRKVCIGSKKHEYSIDCWENRWDLIETILRRK